MSEHSLPKRFFSTLLVWVCWPFSHSVRGDHKRILRELNNETGHLVRREKLRTVQRKASDVSGLDVRPETAKIAAGRLLLIAKARFVVGMNVDENVSLLRKRGIRMFRSFRCSPDIWRSTKDAGSLPRISTASVPDRQKAR